MSEKEIDLLRNIVTDQFSLNLNSDHGVDHWGRVEEVGVYLAQKVGADVELIRLFALLHDSQRQCEGYDPEHGLRASEYVQKLSECGFLMLDQSRLRRLMFACGYHNDQKVRSDDVTINICWDSDRVDLVRVGLSKAEIILVTQIGRDYLNSAKMTKDSLRHCLL